MAAPRTPLLIDADEWNTYIRGGAGLTDELHRTVVACLIEKQAQVPAQWRRLGAAILEVSWDDRGECIGQITVKTLANNAERVEIIRKPVDFKDGCVRAIEESLREAPEPAPRTASCWSKLCRCLGGKGVGADPDPA